MNFKKNSIALASLLCLTALTGCGKNKGEVTLESMKLNGIVTAYMEDETIEWSSLTVTATYSDKTTTTFANSEIEFDVETPKESTKLVVFTSGLHAQSSPYTEGEYDVKAALKASLNTKYSLGSISIGKITPAKYKLRTFELPEFVNKYQAAVDDAGKSAEGAFRKAEELFTVGTLNTFEFAPVATFSKNGVTGKFYVSDNYVKTTSLKIVNGQSKTDAPADSYEIVKGGIKFKDSAAGKSYELSVAPTGFTIGGTTPEVKFSFKVERGLNVYSAKELGALNLTHYTEADFDTEGTTFEEHKGNTKNNSTSNVFFSAELGGYYRPNYKQIWKSFLGQGTFTEAELAAYEDVPAIFFQNDIVLTVNDIPSEYFITAAEEQLFSAPGRAGSLRDDACLYVPIVHDQDVVINGNYFTFNATEIPLCNSTTAVPGLDFYVFPTNYTGAVPPGHASVFKFCGIDPIDSDAYRKAQLDTANGHKGVVKNVNAYGNTSVVNVEQNDKIMEVTGLIFAKNTECGAEYYNNNIKQFQIGLFPDCNVGQPYGGKEQVNRTFVNECKVFDCSNTGICNYHNGGCLVTHSEFNRFGGAPILNAGCTDEWAYGITTCGEDVKLKNEITGAEVYFTAVNASGQFAAITGWETFFNNVGNTLLHDGKLDLIALNMDGHDYVESPNHAYYGDVYLNTYEGSENALRCSIDPSYTLPEWQVYEGVHPLMGAYPPVFKTEKGEVFFTDNQNALLYLDGMSPAPVNWQIQGEYVSVLLPVGNTTLNAVFRLSKLAA